MLFSLMITLHVSHNFSCSLRSDLVKILRETKGRITILKGRTVYTYDDCWTCTTITAILWSDVMKYMTLASFELRVRYISLTLTRTNYIRRFHLSFAFNLRVVIIMHELELTRYDRTSYLQHIDKKMKILLSKPTQSPLIYFPTT